MRRLLGISVLLILAYIVSGCGETVNGMVKDTRRIGGGIKQVFVRE